MKKGLRTALFAMAGLMSLSLASCGDEIVDNGQVIILWSTFNDTYRGVIDRAIQRFKKTHPEYVVQHVKKSGGYTDIKDTTIKGLSVGNYPDMVAVYPDAVAEMLSTGKGLNIEPYMNDEEVGWTEDDFDDIPEEYIKEGQNYAIPGTYSLPICKSTELLFYNNSVLDGLDLSDVDDSINGGLPLDEQYLNNLTWEELFNRLCPAIAEYDSLLPADKRIIKYDSKHASTGSNPGALIGYDGDENMFITLAEQYGLPYTSVNQTTGKGSVDFVQKEDGRFKDVLPEYMELAKMLNLAMQEHTFNGQKYRYLTTANVMGDRTNNCFTANGSGGMLFSIGSSGGLTYQNTEGKAGFDVGVALLPHAEGGPRKAINQGPSIAFLKRGKNKDMEDNHALGAWLFYKELTSTEINISWALATGYAPIRNSVAASKEYKEYASTENKDPGTRKILDARAAKMVAENLPYLYSSPVFQGSGKARTAVGPIFSDIINKEKALMPQEEGTAGYAEKVAQFEAAVKRVFEKAFSNAIK